MRSFVVLLVLVGLFFVASFFLPGGSQGGDPTAAFSSVAHRGLVQTITDRFATRLDPATLQDSHVQGRALMLAGGATAQLVIPASSEQYRRMEFTGATEPIMLTYVDGMKDDKGNTQAQVWRWPETADNAKLSASEQGGLLTVRCEAVAPQSCHLTFR